MSIKTKEAIMKRIEEIQQDEIKQLLSISIDEYLIKSGIENKDTREMIIYICAASQGDITPEMIVNAYWGGQPDTLRRLIK